METGWAPPWSAVGGGCARLLLAGTGSGYQLTPGRVICGAHPQQGVSGGSHVARFGCRSWRWRGRGRRWWRLGGAAPAVVRRIWVSAFAYGSGAGRHESWYQHLQAEPPGRPTLRFRTLVGRLCGGAAHRHTIQALAYAGTQASAHAFAAGAPPAAQHKHVECFWRCSGGHRYRGIQPRRPRRRRLARSEAQRGGARDSADRARAGRAGARQYGAVRAIPQRQC